MRCPGPPSYGAPVEIVGTAKRTWAWAQGLSPWVLDGVLAATMVVLGFATTSGPTAVEGQTYTARDGLAVVLLLAVTVPYVVRSRYPFGVFVTTYVALVLYVGLGYNEGLLPIFVLVGMYAVGAHRSARTAVSSFVIAIAGLLALLPSDAPGFEADNVLTSGALFGAAVLFGSTVQARRLRLEALEQRTEALEREQEEEARRAVADERLHIAQELHDVVAHSMSVIAVQAGAGRHVIDQDPEAAKQALENISSTSRASLGELRRLLGVLREEGEGATYAPVPGLNDLADLVGDVVAAGVPVVTDVEGDLDSVPPAIAFTGYRLVQEALTNVMKHAGPATATVQVGCGTDRLRIEVRDDGRGVNARSDGTGHGLVGMRERVAVFGGTLDAGPVAGGGFRVAAELPYDTAAEEGRP
jgi:signal transduction histidine kinase